MPIKRKSTYTASVYVALPEGVTGVLAASFTGKAPGLTLIADGATPEGAEKLLRYAVKAIQEALDDEDPRPWLPVLREPIRDEKA